MNKEVIGEITLWKGHSYFGSGGYSAGGEVLEGEVKAESIPNSSQGNGFRRKTLYRLTPLTPKAVLKVWCGDGVNRSGWRPLGPNGIIILKQGA